MSYRISAPDEYLAITGAGIRTVKITKSAWVWPLQRCVRFSVQPRDYAMDLQAMTREKLNFKLPTVFTIGPDLNHRDGILNDDDGGARDDGTTTTSTPAPRPGAADRSSAPTALMKYAMLLADSGDTTNSSSNRDQQVAHVESIVKGIIEGETRVLVSSMTMEEIFTEREVFKRRIFRNIQGELDQFGLKIYNANVKELRDAPGSVYFESLSRKAHEGATNQARIDAAEAQLRGNVGEAKRRGEQDREIAKINADTAVQKTERDVERAAAEAKLSTRQVAFRRDVELARAEADRALEAKDEELRREVERRRAAAETERLRGQVVVKATIERESAQQAADAAAYETAAAARAAAEGRQRQADGEAYATRAAADAHAYAETQAAEADAVRRVKEAEGIAALAESYAKMSAAFGGPDGLIKWLMIERGTYVELAKANADAVRGMAPKISVWNTGAAPANGQQQDPTTTMRDVYQMLPPLMSTIHDQTGITLPEWQFGRVAAQTQAVGKEPKANGDA
ncbi:Flotillin-like protein-like protein [Hapsidospora chrysogenum ATCC 11550]|uniref:Flotillin-like protein-like protein n=1 Tax=Hapsidospora chrysogenum (strain ATCC 11550 / CBS 779.69 / DSM 880 / IAM 14645 / JCM 23072 / IMI 49137) TaxID=857340 RepID=A0A086SUS6_HAPC1|nr:Flotillin-like protein-like protein [Hapsidospora chrysogenum ATCC 11550]